MRAEFRRLSSTDDCAPREGNYLQVAGVSMTGLGLRLNAVDLGRFGILRFGGRLGFLRAKCAFVGTNLRLLAIPAIPGL